jgi:hypothetical protein
MSDERKPEGGPVYTPPGQSVLPGMKREISQPPKDWRSWSDGRGNKVDSPAYRGRTSSGGKTIPQPTEHDGSPIRIGSLQLLRDARGAFVIVDWDLPMTPPPEKQDDGEPEELRSRGTAPVKGRMIFRTHADLDAARSAMRVLHQEKLDRAKGLLPNPERVSDLAGKPIAMAGLSLGRFIRGKYKGSFCVVDDARTIADPKKFGLLKEKTLKAATYAFVAIAEKHAAKAKPKKRFVGAPIAFSAPGGGMGGGFSSSSWEKDLPEPGSLSWQSAVDFYARTGRWSFSACYPTGRPPALEEEALAAREAFLAEAGKEPEPAPSPEVRAAFQKLPKKDRVVIEGVLAHFEGATLLTISPKGAS